MKQSAFKNFTLYKPGTKYPCRLCQCDYKIRGDTWLESKKSCLAADGSKAFRIVWVCHSGHKVWRGYSKPVDWAKNLGGNKTYDDGISFKEEDDEIENEYKEMLEHARRKAGSGSGKLYY